MKKTKISKRLAVLLLLLVIVAVGGAYVLNSVNTGEGVLAAAVYKASGIPMTYQVQGYGAAPAGKMDYFGVGGFFGNDEYWKKPSNNPLYGDMFAEKAKPEDGKKKPPEEEKKKCSPLMPGFMCGAPEKLGDAFGGLEDKVGRDKALVGAGGDCAKKSACKGFKATKNSDGGYDITPF